MAMLAALSDWLMVAPLAFTVGFFTGLALASKYRITRANPPNTTDDTKGTP
jgi:hypothetical protein